MHHGFVRIGPVFIVNGQSPEVLEPWESALDNPSFWHGDKSVRPFVRPEYDIQVAMQQSHDRVPDSLAPVTSVRQNPFQPREFVSHGFEYLFRPYAVMDVSRMDSHWHGQPQSVNHYVLLPALYLFVSVYSPLTINMMGGPDTPWVDDPKAGTLRPARKTADNAAEGVEDLFKQALVLPLAEIVIHCLPRSEIRGEHSPLHAGLHDVQDAVKNRAQWIFSESFFGV